MIRAAEVNVQHGALPTRDAGGGGDDDDMCLGGPCASRPILLGTHKQHIVVF
jgi:hypothetical protein